MSEEIIGTPAPEAASQTTDQNLEQKLAEMQKEVDGYKSRFDQSQKKITELAAEKATIEARYREVGINQEIAKTNKFAGDTENIVKNVFENLDRNPEVAIKQLSDLIVNVRNEAGKNAAEKLFPQVQEAIETREFVTNIRKENPKLAAIEPLVLSRVKDLMSNQKLDFKSATLQAVDEFNKSLGNSELPDYQKAKMEEKKIIPAGAMSEKGASTQVLAKPKEQETKFEDLDKYAREDFEERKRLASIRARGTK